MSVHVQKEVELAELRNNSVKRADMNSAQVLTSQRHPEIAALAPSLAPRVLHSVIVKGGKVIRVKVSEREAKT